MFFFSQLLDLISRTATVGESNSLLLVGPRGSGKTMVRQGYNTRPPLSKKSFPVCRVGGKRPVGRSGFFFFPNLFFYKRESTGG